MVVSQGVTLSMENAHIAASTANFGERKKPGRWAGEREQAGKGLQPAAPAPALLSDPISG